MAKERNAAMFHGAGNTAEGNWFQNGKRRFKKAGYPDVWVPSLPNAETPQTATWLNFVKAEKPPEFFDGALIIAHSAGVPFAFRLLQALPEGIIADQMIGIAGFVELGKKSQYYHYKSGLLEEPFDWDKIKRSCRRFDFVHSDNDEYECDYRQAYEMSSHLGGWTHIYPGEGHFNLETDPKYDDLPLLMDIAHADEIRAQIERDCLPFFIKLGMPADPIWKKKLKSE